jgi:hypothetical protein
MRLQLALVAFPCAVPQRAVDPGDARDEAVGFDGAKDRAGFRVDLMDLALAIVADPQSFPSAHAMPESPPPPGAGIVTSTSPVFGSIF